GTGFQAGATVSFGAAPATSVAVASASIIPAVTPAGPSGAADVTITNPDGQAATLAGAWLYTAPPVASSIFPAQGPPSGGTIALVSGAQFSANALAFVGGAPVETVVGTSLNHLAVTMPAGTGTVDVV